MAARGPLFNVLADPTADVGSCSSKAVTTLVLVSSHGGVGFLSSNIYPSKVLISP